MSDVVVSQFITLDGVFQDPGGSEGSERGGWAFQFNRGREGDQFKLDEVMTAGALLLGRVTYEGFAQAWPSMTDEVGFADKMNRTGAYNCFRTLPGGHSSLANLVRLFYNIPLGVHSGGANVRSIQPCRSRQATLSLSGRE